MKHLTQPQRISHHDGQRLRDYARIVFFDEGLEALQGFPENGRHIGSPEIDVSLGHAGIVKHVSDQGAHALGRTHDQIDVLVCVLIQAASIFLCKSLWEKLVMERKGSCKS